MRVTCEVCEKATATVLCMQDEAAMCAACDENVHAANKVVGKHERIPIENAKPPQCDICQDASAYFFCKDDRALLCRACDVSIHSGSAAASNHERFFVPGARVGLQGCCTGHSHAHEHSQPIQKAVKPSPPPRVSQAKQRAAAPQIAPVPSYSDDDAAVPVMDDMFSAGDLLNIPGMGEGFSVKDAVADDDSWNDICKMLEGDDSKKATDGPYRKRQFTSMDVYDIDLSDGDVPSMDDQSVPDFKRSRAVC
eukprot:CAMPEP_0182862220 /NCGR_PEP_ID=MMETSP0034_2-20130328/5931_1 /TAXON_ID=156128 /ORGANISM="Nephroselmis pyriformis, Strain CCMP717" /LENGTH=250 /DNA_ID=CAMNT_0024994251 /DNA_START=66 /DNA_END=818 /DNA_ORIENTATION=+